MATSTESALRVAQAYADRERPDIRVTGFYEDEDDYLATIETISGGPFRDGESFIFVSKETGQVWTGSPGETFEKVQDMTPVES